MNSVEAKLNLQKAVLLVCSISFFGIGVLIKTTNWLDGQSSPFISGTLLKVGFVLGLAWIAYPHLQQLGWDKVRGTLGAGVVLVMILMAIRPKIGAIAASILVAGTIATALLGWIRQFLGMAKPKRKN